MTANLQIITDIKSNVMRIPVTAERFRPAPGEIERFNVKDQADASEPEGLLDPTYARLSVIGLSEARIEVLLPSYHRLPVFFLLLLLLPFYLLPCLPSAVFYPVACFFCCCSVAVCPLSTWVCPFPCC